MNFLVIGVGPLIGAAALAWLFVEATRSLSEADESYSGQTILGLAAPLAIGYGFLALGVVLLVVWRWTGSGHERFFERKPFEAVDPAVASGQVKREETVGL